MKERRKNGEQNVKRGWEGWREIKEEGKVGMTEDLDREEDKKERGGGVDENSEAETPSTSL